MGEWPVASRGIPHLAKDERDVGHPSLVTELRARRNMTPISPLLVGSYGDSHVRRCGLSN